MVNVDNIDQLDAMPDSWLAAAEALRRLNVRPQTLYAYVSRGLVEARADPGEARRSLYRASDIERLSQRKARGRRVADVASHAIAWGEPVLESAISTIARGRLYYRGQDAAALAAAAALEDVARLLWQADDPLPEANDAPGGGAMKARAFQVLAARAAADPPAAGRGETLLIQDAAQVLSALGGALAGGGEGPGHLRLASVWDADPDMIRRALVLLADHELNASTFAVRVAASTGASLAASALAGLAALSGPRHGGHFARVQAFLDETRARGAGPVVSARLEQGVEIPGFGHPLYPGGDPRAGALLQSMALTPAERETAETVLDLTGTSPNIDFALCVMTRSMGLPSDAPFALFAAGRCAGWLAHALEQHRTGSLIRPRARYVGPEPVQSSAT
jgi:citrate synthase